MKRGRTRAGRQADRQTDRHDTRPCRWFVIVSQLDNDTHTHADRETKRLRAISCRASLVKLSLVLRCYVCHVVLLLLR